MGQVIKINIKWVLKDVLGDTVHKIETLCKNVHSYSNIMLSYQ